MARTHTPGPWLVCEDERNVYQPDLDASITGGFPLLAVLDDEEAHANARLMAAAPDLLAVCTALVEHHMFDPKVGLLVTRAIEAITKATLPRYEVHTDPEHDAEWAVYDADQRTWRKRRLRFKDTAEQDAFWANEQARQIAHRTGGR